MNLKRYGIKIVFLALMFSGVWGCGVRKSLHHTPKIEGYQSYTKARTVIADTVFRLGPNHLAKNKFGLWEMYLEGDPLALGTANAILAKKLIQRQERLFFSKVEELVPSRFKQWLLRKFLAWYNRKLYLNIPEEYKTEIYGVSRAALDDYDYIAPKYLRSLYLHGAHDIGHALKDLALVGCTSFAVWDEHSEDGQLLLGRNFDFYAGDEFARDKIIAFVKPLTGYKFASVTWGGMIGVVSGMNDQGITVTINAGKSDIPLVAKTPISILTREILQYASTIDEAVAIAKKRQVFVSESILIGSAKDHRAVTIEVAPNNFGVYEVENRAELLCTNHFQSDTYAEDKNNRAAKIESHSVYRYDRLRQLIAENGKINPKKAVAILRNKDGLNDVKLGLGNEKALNQLLAHHAVIFQPEQLRFYVSSNPYQLGSFVSYDLNKVFQHFENKTNESIIYDSDKTIPADKFLASVEFKNYELYRGVHREIMSAIEKKQWVSAEKLTELVTLNPDFWEVYYTAGLYHYKRGYLSVAKKWFEKALTKEITTSIDQLTIERYLHTINRKIR
ncbi:C45 family peptidase [Flavobacteriaceae bacterium F08102]|nr:C45 family peptidase [Flavobacteriaceae bacterium F08102]